MTTREWYHRYIYLKAKREVNIPEHQPKRGIKTLERYEVTLNLVEENRLLFTGLSSSSLPLSDCGKFFMIESKDKEGQEVLVSIPVTPDIYVIAKRIQGTPCH